MVEGDLLIDHEPVDNMEEKSNADGTAPEPPSSDQSKAAATTQVADLLVKTCVSYCVWYNMDHFYVLYLADPVSFYQSFDDVIPVTSETDENNSMALALVQSGSSLSFLFKMIYLYMFVCTC